MLDIAIIGTGPAGISSALTAKARGKNFKLFGSKSLSEKISKAHQINNYPGIYGKTGAEFALEFKNHLFEQGIEIQDSKITNIFNMNGYFTLLSGQEQFDSKTVIIATGVDFGKSIIGEKEFLGRGVSYCATCDGMLYKEKNVAVIAYSKVEEKEAEFLSTICKKVYYIPQYKDVELQETDVLKIVNDSPLEIRGSLKVSTIVLKANNLQVDGVFILRESIAPSILLSGLEVKDNHIVVNRLCQTSIPGVFAAGDITGTPYQYAKSVGEGNVATLSAVQFLAKNNTK